MRVMPRWGIGPTTTPDAGNAPSRHENTIESVMRMGFWVPQWGMEPMTNISQAMPRPNMEPTATPDAGDVLLGYGTDDQYFAPWAGMRCPVGA